MIDICVPVYNEGENIKALLDSLRQKVRTDFRLIIIYDFEEDNTLPVLRSIQDDYPFDIALIKNCYGRGVAKAILTGIKSIKSEYWVLTMADLSDELSTIDQMYEKIQQGYDMVAGSRYMRGGKKHGGPVIKSLFSRCAGLGMHILIGLPIHDLSNAFKMYRTNVTKTIPLESTDGFEVCTELAIKTYLAGYRETEVPTEWYDRTAGESNFKMWKWIPKYLHWCFYGISLKWSRKKPKFHRDLKNKH